MILKHYLVTLVFVLCIIFTSACSMPLPGADYHFIYFNPNTKDVNSTMESQQIAVNTEMNLKPYEFSRTGYRFLGWSTSNIDTEVAYIDGAAYPMEDADITLYAVWAKKEETKTIVFESQKGSLLPIQNVPIGENAKEPSPPSRKSHAFEGWFKESECINRWEFDNDIITDDITLYAKWLECTENLEYTLIPSNTGYMVSKGTANIIGEVIIPAYWAGKKVTVIEENGFANCRNLTSIILPDSITEIGKNAFHSCENLNKISIPDDVDSIKESTFYNCRNITHIKLPKNLIVIHDKAFKNCTELENIFFPENIQSIGNRAFFNCEKLIKLILPSTISTIGKDAFMYCESLEEVELPNSLERIEILTFAYCKNLNTVEFSSKISRIKANAFLGCTKLTKVVLPDSIEYIGTDAFKDCIGLKDITINAVTPPVLDAFALSGNTSVANIYVPGESLKSYKNTNIWEN